MTPLPDLAAAASLLAEPARAAMLSRLMDGRSWTATELARAAGVAPSTGSAHLAKLLDPGWIQVHAQGRFRYFRLAGTDIASFLEQFAGISPQPKARTPGELRAGRALRYCRLCYDHLAGRLGVALAEGLLARGWLTADFQLTPEGDAGLAALGLQVPGGTGKGCMDWSERRLHLAGGAGQALAAGLVAMDWLQRDRTGRALYVTPAGAGPLAQLMGGPLPAP